MNIYVGNLSFKASEEDLRDAFGGYGKVTSAIIMKDRETGQSRGFGFVEMASSEEAKAAILGLDGRDLQGRILRVNEARPRAERPAGMRDNEARGRY
jgi:RNA recognition motif-containing protein